MNEIIEKQNELFEIFSKMVSKQNKKHNGNIDAHITFFNPKLRKQFLNSYSSLNDKKAVEKYLSEETKLEQMEEAFLEKMNIYLENAQKIRTNGLSLDTIDFFYRSLDEAYQYYLTYFKSVSFSVNKENDSKENTEHISISSIDMEASVHDKLDFDLQILPRNINHLLEVNTYKKSHRANKEDNILKRLYDIFSDDDFTLESYMNFILKDSKDYIKYLLGADVRLSSAEKDKLDALGDNIDLDFELNDFYASDIIEKSVSFMFIHKYKYLPEIILDYEGVADFNLYNKNSNPLVLASGDEEKTLYDYRTLTRATSSNSVLNNGNPNYWIASYDSETEAYNTFKAKYYSLLSLAEVCSSVVSDYDIETRPSTDYLTSLNTIESLFSVVDKTENFDTKISCMWMIHSELEKHQISDPNISRCINLDYLFNLCQELKAKPLKNEMGVKPKDYGAYKNVIDKFLQSPNLISKINTFNISPFSYFKEQKIPEIRYLIPLATELYTKNENNLPKASLIGINFDGIDNPAITNQSKSFIQMVLDLRVRGRDYKIDSVYSDTAIYQLTTVRQYEDREFMVGRNRLTQPSRNKKRKPIGLISKLLPVAFSSALALSMVNVHKSDVDLEISEETIVQENNLDIGSSYNLSDGIVYKESSDADYGGANNFGVIGENFPAGDYRVSAFALVYEGEIVYSTFDTEESLDKVTEDVANSLNVPLTSIEKYVHIDSPVYGWVNGDDINFENKVIKTSYKVNSSESGQVSFNRNGEEVFINIIDNQGNYLKTGDIVIGSDNNTYVIENSKIIDYSKNLEEAIISDSNLSDNSFDFKVKSANPFYILGLALSMGNLVYQSKKR